MIYEIIHHWHDGVQQEDIVSPCGELEPFDRLVLLLVLKGVLTEDEAVSLATGADGPERLRAEAYAWAAAADGLEPGVTDIADFKDDAPVKDVK